METTKEQSMQGSAVERFWAKVQITDSCWLWTAAIQYGYGVFSL